MFARIAGSALPGALREEPDCSALGGPLYAAEHQWVAAQRRALGAIGERALHAAMQQPDLADRSLRPPRRGASGGGARGGGAKPRPPRAGGGGQVLRRPPRLPSIAAQPRPELPPASRPGAPATPNQLWRWLAAASSFAELDGLCRAFGGGGSFTARHAALAARRLGAVPLAPADRPLLLAARLAARLAPAAAATAVNVPCGAGGGARPCSEADRLLPCDAAGAVWGLARVPGYAAEPELLQGLLEVARPAARRATPTPRPQQQQQQQEQEEEEEEEEERGGLTGSDLSLLAAGLAAQGLPMPGWLLEEATQLLGSCGGALGPADLHRLLLAAAQHEQHGRLSLEEEGAAAGVSTLPWPAQAASGGGAHTSGDARALCAAAARACLARLPEFSPEALIGVVLSLEALGMRGACGELFERAAQLLVSRREEAARALRAQQAQAAHQRAARGGGRRQHQAGSVPGGGGGGDASPRAAAAASRYSALARHDPVLCVMLLKDFFFQPGAEQQQPASAFAS